MSSVKIRQALEERLAAIASALPTQWENAAFSPVSGVAYQQVFMLYNEPLNLEAGVASYQEYGIFQVDLRYPVNTGPGDASVRAEALRQWFYKGLTLTAGGLSVTISNTAAILSGRNEGDRFVIPVRIFFHSNVN